LRTNSSERPCSVTGAPFGGVDAVLGKAPGEGPPALADLLGQRAVEDAEPVAVGLDLVLGVDHRDRVLQVEDGRQRGLDDDVAHPGRVVAADRIAAVDADIQVQPVVHQQHARRRASVALVAEKLLRVLQRHRPPVRERDLQRPADDRIAGAVEVRSLLQRCATVEHVARVLDDLGAAPRVVGGAALAAVGLAQDIGAVQRVVQAAPARVGGVERVARIGDRHHELRAGLLRQLGVDIPRRHPHPTRVGCEVADLAQEGAVARHGADRAGVLGVPGVDLDLQPVALGQQRGILRRQVADDAGEALPEGVVAQPGGGQDLLVDEGLEDGGDLQAADRGAWRHGVGRGGRGGWKRGGVEIGARPGAGTACGAGALKPAQARRRERSRVRRAGCARSASARCRAARAARRRG